MLSQLKFNSILQHIFLMGAKERSAQLQLLKSKENEKLQKKKIMN
jgi:hypothetical protein